MRGANVVSRLQNSGYTSQSLTAHCRNGLFEWLQLYRSNVVTIVSHRQASPQARANNATKSVVAHAP